MEYAFWWDVAEKVNADLPAKEMANQAFRYVEEMEYSIDCGLVMGCIENALNKLKEIGETEMARQIEAEIEAHKLEWMDDIDWEEVWR